MTAVTRRQGQRLIDLAREAMVTRSRDLDVFVNADPADVRLIEDGNGLWFAADYTRLFDKHAKLRVAIVKMQQT